MTHWRRNGIVLGLVGLYLGVFLGGMALPFAQAWLIGTAAMLVYTQLMRPAEHWMGLVRLPLTLLVLAALVALLAYAGAGLAKLTGAPPTWLGPALALGGVALSRSVWSAAKARELDAFLEQAITEVEEAGRSLRADAGDEERR